LRSNHEELQNNNRGHNNLQAQDGSQAARTYSNVCAHTRLLHNNVSALYKTEIKLQQHQDPHLVLLAFDRQNVIYTHN